MRSKPWDSTSKLPSCQLSSSVEEPDEDMLKIVRLVDRQRYVRVVTFGGNSVYLAMGIHYLTDAASQDINILRGFIYVADWNFLSKQSIPSSLILHSDPKSLSRNLQYLLDRLDCKNVATIQQQIINIVGKECHTALALILLARSLTFTWQKEHKELQLVGNYAQCIKDFSIDARGVVLRLASSALDLRLNIWYQVGTSAKPYLTQRKYGEGRSSVDLIIVKHRCILVMPEQLKQSIMRVVSTMSTASNASTVDVELTDAKRSVTKNCTRCGRVKLQRFCVCKKEGAKDRYRNSSQQRCLEETTNIA